MVLSRDQERWAAVLWVEKNHGEEGTAYIAQQVQRLSNEGAEAGIATWKTVAERLDQLSGQSSTNRGSA